MSQKIIDFRSDTVTRPSQAMMEAMMTAPLGDDVLGDDPTVIELEEKSAAMFGMEAGLFCVSGTMTNQLAIRVHCPPASEIICDKLSHIYLYEGGGIATNALSSVRLIDGNRGRINAQQVLDNINNPLDIHLPLTRLVSLENTMNKGGGCTYSVVEIEAIKNVCTEKQLGLHLDGARLFNAIVSDNIAANVYGNLFDSISICLSKGLGCPVGSVLLGDKEFIKKAKRFRKLMGGGWRQAGVLAAAGIYALDNNIERLQIDHEQAKIIEACLQKQSYAKSVLSVDTNIVIFTMQDETTAAEFVERLKEKHILCIAFSKQQVRFVTHLDISGSEIEQLCDVLSSLKF
jgi:threonine aldolase